MFWQAQNTFLSSVLLIVSLPLSVTFHLADSNPLFSFTGQVRQVHLYTENHRRGLYLQMTQDGMVSGSGARTPYSILELKSVQPGHVIIRGWSSSLFLCMDGGGSLRGQRDYTEADCTFRELLLADGYTRFLSSHYGFPVSLVSKHSPDRHTLPFTRFLPIRDILTRESISAQPPPDNERYFSLDSGDLLGMGRNSVVSPQLSLDV